MILSFANRLSEHSDNQRWVSTPDFCYYDHTLTELAGKKLGLVGYGDIGKKVAQIAKAFEMDILIHKKTPLKEKEDGIEETDLETLLRESDYVSLHCPLTPENEKFINRSNLEKMKDSAFLINTSRGGLIHEQDLADALNSGIIAGAALDVLTVEPPAPDQPLLRARNCKISPHIAWATLEARKKLMQIVIRNIEAFIAGKPENVVS
jgi:glycerate dehydrogenase